MSSSVIIQYKKLHPKAQVPALQSEQAAGADLHACLEGPVLLESGGRAIISTGLSIALPVGYEGQIRPRSGLAAKHGVTVLNAPGTIDSDYRGEVGVILINHGAEPYEVNHGDRIAQLVVARHEVVEFTEVDDLEITERGSSGFGGTGK